MQENLGHNSQFPIFNTDRQIQLNVTVWIKDWIPGIVPQPTTEPVGLEIASSTVHIEAPSAGIYNDITLGVKTIRLPFEISFDAPDPIKTHVQAQGRKFEPRCGQRFSPRQEGECDIIDEIKGAV